MWPTTLFIILCQILLLICQFAEFSSLIASKTTAISDSGTHVDEIGRMLLKREPDPLSCQTESACKSSDDRKDNNNNGVLITVSNNEMLSQQSTTFLTMRNISSQKEEEGDDDDNEELGKAKTIANSSARSLLEILQIFGEAFNGDSSSQMMSAEEYVGLMISANSSVAELFGGPFGTVFNGVRKALVPNTDPVLKVIAKLNAELERQFEADSYNRLDEMIRQLERHYTSICYNGKILCVIDLLQPFYNVLTTITTAVDSSPKEEAYNKTVDKFLAICNDNIAYDSLNYIRMTYGLMLNAVNADVDDMQNKVESLLSAAKMIQIHAIKLVAMATLCAEFSGWSDYYTEYFMHDMDIILSGMSTWIQRNLVENPPSSSASPPPDIHSSGNAAVAIHYSIWHSQCKIQYTINTNISSSNILPSLLPPAVLHFLLALRLPFFG